MPPSCTGLAKLQRDRTGWKYDNVPKWLSLSVPHIETHHFCLPLGVRSRCTGSGVRRRLIERVRAASQMTPDKAQIEARFQSFARYSAPMSAYRECASDDVVHGVVGTFQIRISDDWIMVDGGAEEEMISWDVEFSADDHVHVGQVSRAASLIVVTHENVDHTAGIVRGPWEANLSKRALLTSKQLEMLIAGPAHLTIQVSPERASQYLSVSYRELLPIAKGAVLIKAPGQTPGSQMIYVKLERSTEFLLVDDIVWVASAIDCGSKRPFALSSRLSEGGNSLAAQIRWLQ